MESFGARLKREREQRKITLDDISVATKIAPRFLLAIEEEQFDQLPGGIFNKGFVRSYARHLGIDENQAVADYVAASGPAVPENLPEEGTETVVPEVRLRDAGDGAAGFPWGVLAIALLIVAFGFAVWGFHSRTKPTRPGVMSQPVTTESSTTPRPDAAPAAPVQPAAPGVSSAPPPAATPEAAGTSSPATTHSGTPDPGAFLVQIKAREDSWVAISADGKEIMQDTLPASAEKSVGARDQIVIKTGNAGALDISFNGQKLPSQGSDNQVKTLTFDPNGLRPPR